ncbi:hypothetical protein [Cupriavidus sp. UME77]|uniref:hypothetical protein n=1 Tax=Cupriavidus sp. UME77 TaxID=1862321 RepID=UPI0016010E6C|nr:hypothetical protein [Cupriavidus sp. UME77]MBB1634998.1 hypothetical protein [Cupriavidus sp. UME77]
MEYLGTLLHRLDELFGPHWGTVAFTNLFAAVFIFWLVRVARHIASSEQARAVNYLLMLLGALLGWGGAMLFSPYGESDKGTFDHIGKLASVFLSGYLVSKIDRFIEATSFVDKAPVTETWIRAGLFTATALLALIFVVTNRMYFRP